MAFTMHSHSGEFCPGHAVDQLEEIVNRAIDRGYSHLGLSEHMPRLSIEDLYPEELIDLDQTNGQDNTITSSSSQEQDEAAAAAKEKRKQDIGQNALAVLRPRHEAYLLEAARLRDLYRDKIHVLIGFETDYLRPADYLPFIQSLAAHPDVDYFVGSLHHVNGIPIDYDKAMYQKAVASTASSPPRTEMIEGHIYSEHGHENGTDVTLANRYYDEQFAMLQALQPRVVGHFDLHRLLSSNPNLSPCSPDSKPTTTNTNTNTKPYPPETWSKILRNLRYIASYSGILELNTAALRKGLDEPYPAFPIAREWLDIGGRFTLSDDSHGVGQVGTNYLKGLDYLEMTLGVGSVWVLERDEDDDGGKNDDNRNGNGEKKGMGMGIREREVCIKRIREVVGRW